MVKRMRICPDCGNTSRFQLASGRTTCLDCGAKVKEVPYLKWENKGDVNYLDHGGCLVRQSFSEEEQKLFPCLASARDVIWQYPLPNEFPYDGEEEKHATAYCHIDPEDSWIKWEDVASASGMTVDQVKDLSPEDQACMVVDYYGPENCGGQVLVRTRQDLVHWMIDVGAAGVL